jgi:hypothetical protein
MYYVVRTRLVAARPARKYSKSRKKLKSDAMVSADGHAFVARTPYKYMKVTNARLSALSTTLFTLL